MTPPPSLQDLIDTVQQDSPSDDLLDLLITASATVQELEAVNDALIGHYVDRCRRAGRSWSQISTALGVSKQAVHKRFAGPIADRLMERPTLERLTARARRVLVVATELARARQSTRIDPFDLLLGLYAEPEGLAAKVLEGMQLTRDLAATAVRESAAPRDGRAGRAPAQAPAGGGTAGTPGAGEPSGAGAGAGADAGSGWLPPDEAAASVLRDAAVEAIERGHNYIGTEHILLALVRDPDTPAAQLLAGLGASPDETRVRVRELLRGFAAGAAWAGGPAAGKP
jgi:Clp amino terminal domain, pathogenicity island component